MDVQDIFKGRALAGCAGMTGADHHLEVFAISNAFDYLDVFITGLNGMWQRADRKCVTTLRPQPRSGLEIEFWAGSDEQIVVIQVDLFFALGFFCNHVLIALIRVDFGQAGFHKIDVLPLVNRGQLKIVFSGAMWSIPTHTQDGP